MVIEARREAANYRRTTTAATGKRLRPLLAPVAEAESSQLQTEGGVDLGEGTKSHLLEAESEPQDRRADAESDRKETETGEIFFVSLTQHEGAKHPLLTAIQLAIIRQSMASDFRPTFPKLRRDLGGKFRGEIDECDPLETCGDAAMHVVITEILVAATARRADGKAIYQRPVLTSAFPAIHGPLLSNSTFLYFIQSAGVARRQTRLLSPKFPGNAFEVFAGALALKSPPQLSNRGSLSPSKSSSTQPLRRAGISYPCLELDEYSEHQRRRSAGSSGRGFVLATGGFDFLLPPKLAWTPIVDAVTVGTQMEKTSKRKRIVFRVGTMS
ncbi:hypothetical protein B0H14DRAFT_3136014 [Mycena olivaceomarginata]|nr:hypothetical protein B0H14DRAFT_3136014 [Mycena olivaceomarginata]